MEFPMKLVKEGCASLNLPVQPDASMEQRLTIYAQLLMRWNEKMNLTAITEPADIAIKHFVDSAALLRYVSLPADASIIDVGTGAGFPGLVLKIFRPDIQLTLLDSQQKRLYFLEAVCRDLELDAVLLHARAEDGGRNPAYREQFDLATARAVARLPVLMEYCLPFVKKGGSFAALKGPEGEREQMESSTAVSLLGGFSSRLFSYELPGGDRRSLIVTEKKTHTPTKYPRNPGQIAKKSL